MSGESFGTVNLGIECPICKKQTLTMIYKTIRIPYVGDLLISTIICGSCRFKISDAWTMLSTGKHKKVHKVRITKETINDLVCASAGSRILIPEIGAEIQIKTFDAAHITTIEGVLAELRDTVRGLLETTPNRARAQEILDILVEEIEQPTGRLSIILEDPSRHSAIIPHKYWIMRTEKERPEAPHLEQIKTIGEKIIKKWRKTAGPPRGHESSRF
mgnify:CR=1 FL=1